MIRNAEGYEYERRANGTIYEERKPVDDVKRVAELFWLGYHSDMYAVVLYKNGRMLKVYETMKALSLSPEEQVRIQGELTSMVEAGKQGIIVRSREELRAALHQRKKKKPKYTAEEMADKIRRYYRPNLTRQEIADILGISTSTLDRYREEIEKAFGGPLFVVTKGRLTEKVLNNRKKHLNMLADAFVPGMNAKDLAAASGMTYETVRKYAPMLIEMGIPLRYVPADSKMIARLQASHQDGITYREWAERCGCSVQSISNNRTKLEDRGFVFTDNGVYRKRGS